MNEWRKLAEKRGWHPTVPAQKREKRWPLERAELIRKHAEQRGSLRAEAETNYHVGFDDGRRRALADIAERWLNKGEMVRDVYREASRELSRTAGQTVAGAVDRSLAPWEVQFRLMDEMRRRALDVAMQMATIRAVPGPAATSVVLRIDFERIPSTSICIDGYAGF